MDLRVGFVCDRGLSAKRPVNEDRCLVLEDRGLFVVCDGVGGHNSGEVASQLAVDTIEEAVEHLDDADVEESLRSAIRYANRDIYEMASSHSSYDGMGTTVALLYLDRERGRAVIGHAGDSRVYRYDGELHRETVDHTDVDDAVRAGRLSRQEALGLGKQNTINRALGIESDVAAEFRTVTVEDGDAYLLCSDGVTRHVDDDELEDLFASGLAPDAMCDEIRARCYARGAEDNLTAIVVRTGDVVVAPARSVPSTRRRIPLDPPPERRPLAGTPQRQAVRPALLLGLALVLGIVGFIAGRGWSRWFADATPPLPPAAAAREALERGDAAGARTVFARLVAEEPRRADYQYWLGRACLESGDARTASRCFEEALRLDAGATDAYLYLAAAYQSDGRPKEAADALKKYADATAPANGPPNGAPSAAASTAR